MSDTIRQMHNANRIRRALVNYRCYVMYKNHGKRYWREVGPLLYFANRQTRRAGGSAVLCRVRIGM